jgi:hypothetical protein
MMLALIGTGANYAQAAYVCDDHGKIMTELARKFSETLDGAGLANSGVLVELTVSPDGGWTILMTEPGGRTCVVGAGHHWQKVEQVAKGESS